MTQRIFSATAELQVAPKDGADATVYRLVPSVTQVKRKTDGTCLPDSLTCEAYSKTGEADSVSGGTIKFVLAYKTGGTSAEFSYGSRIIITADMASVQFRLYVNGVVVDQQTVAVVDDGKTGGDGPMGKRGALPYPAGEWDAKTRYTATENIAPYVWYKDGKTYYVLNKPGSVSGTPPPQDYESAKNWIPFENHKAVYAELFMANFGKLASAVFWGDYMFSQKGVDANGMATSDYSLFDPQKIGQAGCPFTPNLLLDFLLGKFVGDDVDIKGGRIGALEIIGNMLKSSDLRSGIEIGSSTGRSLRLGGLYEYLINMRLDHSADGYGNKGINIQSYGNNNVCLSLVANAGSKFAQNSIGPHRFYQRSGEVWDAPGVLWCGEVFTERGAGSTYLQKQWGNGIDVAYAGLNSNKEYVFNYNGLAEDIFVTACAHIQNSNDGYQCAIPAYNIGDGQFSIIWWNASSAKMTPKHFQVTVTGRNRYKNYGV